MSKNCHCEPRRNAGSLLRKAASGIARPCPGSSSPHAAGRMGSPQKSTSVAVSAETYQICHCEPVRRLVWQSHALHLLPTQRKGSIVHNLRLPRRCRSRCGSVTSRLWAATGSPFTTARPLRYLAMTRLWVEIPTPVCGLAPLSFRFFASIIQKESEKYNRRRYGAYLRRKFFIWRTRRPWSRG